MLHAERSRDLESRFATVLDELAHQYVVGFEPAASPPGWRAIRVEMTDRRYRVRARKGYRITPE